MTAKKQIAMRLLPEPQEDPRKKESAVRPPRSSTRVAPVKPFKSKMVHEDDGESNWLVSYADMMTLLFGFFVILTAFSSPNAAKLEQLKKETAKAMKVDYQNPYQDLAKLLADILKEARLDREVKIEEIEDGIVLTSKGTLFFDSGLAQLRPEAENLMRKIAAVLVEKSKAFRVIVEGHTDDKPINGGQFASNWELSATRASTVVRLIESAGFPRENLRPVGLADTEALYPNRDPAGNPIEENQAKNRRIVVRILRKLPERVSAIPKDAGGK